MKTIVSCNFLNAFTKEEGALYVAVVGEGHEHLLVGVYIPVMRIAII